MKLLFCSCLCLWCCVSVTAQKNKKTKMADLSFAALDSLVMLYFHRGDYLAATTYAEQGAEKARIELGETDSIYTKYLSDLGFFYYQTAHYQDAEAVFVKTFEIQKKTIGEQHPSYLETLNNLASLYQKLDNYPKAEALFLQIIATEQKNPHYQNYDYSFTKNNLATLYRDKGELEKAQACFQDALQLLSQKPLPSKEEQMLQYAKILDNLAMTYNKMGKYEQAEPLFRQVLDINASFLGKEHPDYAATLNNLAALYSNLNRYEQAEALYLQTIEIDKKTLGDNHPSNAINLNNLAELYRKIGKDYEAQKLYIAARDLLAATLGKEHLNYIASLNNLALLEAHLGNTLEAERLYLQAQKLWEKKLGKEHPDYANTLHNLANLYEAQKKYDQAEPRYRQALEVRAKTLGTTHPDYLKTLHHLASLYGNMGKFEQASSTINAAIWANCKQKSIDSSYLINHLDKIADYEFYSNTQLISSLQAFFQIQQQQYQRTHDKIYLQQGYLALQAAINCNEKIRNSFNDEKDKLRVLDQMNSLVYQAIATGLILAEDAKQTYLQDLFAYAEQNKSILLVDAIKGNRAQILGDLPDSLALLEQELQRKKDVLKTKQYQTKNSTTKAALVAEENELNEKIRVFVQSLKGKYPKYHALKYEQITAQAKDIQQLLDPNTLFLEYFVADSVVYIFSVGKQTLNLLPIQLPKDSLTAHIRRLRGALTNYEMLQTDLPTAYAAYTQSAFWFYQNLLEPALKVASLPAPAQGEVNHLILVTDGELGHLPFETFLVQPAPAQGGAYRQLHYVANDFKISYNYSATLWKENKTASAKQNNGQLFALAADYTPITDKKIMSFRRPKQLDLRQNLGQLPAVKEEVAGLETLFLGKFCQDTAANEATFKAQAANYGVIHLAMHGLLNKNAPMLSSLAFTENGDSSQDNFLEAWEISKLKLNADLVVLSACETGFGKFQQGEGVMSLARSFMYAGAPSLVMSMWSVNDASTALLMQYFYKNLQKGQDKAAALRNAKLQYLSNAEGVAAHPAFWSPFVLLGDSRPIYIASISNAIWWWSLGCIGLVAVLGGLFWAIKRKRTA